LVNGNAGNDVGFGMKGGKIYVNGSELSIVTD